MHALVCIRRWAVLSYRLCVLTFAVESSEVAWSYLCQRCVGWSISVVSVVSWSANLLGRVLRHWTALSQRGTETTQQRKASIQRVVTPQFSRWRKSDNYARSCYICGFY